MPELRILESRHHALHPYWCRLIRSVFTRGEFERWISWDEWDADYRAYALYDGDRPIASVSLTQMRLVLDGTECRGWQFGAVCVDPQWRGGGHARTLVEAALADCGDDPVLLFANPRVRQFYPRFGFVPRDEWVFEAQHSCTPAVEVLGGVDVDLASLLPLLIGAPIQRIRFGFTPERLWPNARAIAVDAEADFFVRGCMPTAPHKFPLLAQT